MTVPFEIGRSPFIFVPENNLQDLLGLLYFIQLTKRVVEKLQEFQSAANGPGAVELGENRMFIRRLKYGEISISGVVDLHSRRNSRLALEYQTFSHL